MLRALRCEYESMVKKRKMEMLYAVICYYRMPKFRVRVLVRWLTIPLVEPRAKNLQRVWTV